LKPPLPPSWPPFPERPTSKKAHEQAQHQIHVAVVAEVSAVKDEPPSLPGAAFEGAWPKRVVALAVAAFVFQIDEAFLQRVLVVGVGE
jgi:hypothetical protein